MRRDGTLKTVVRKSASHEKRQAEHRHRRGYKPFADSPLPEMGWGKMLGVVLLWAMMFGSLVALFVWLI